MNAMDLIRGTMHMADSLTVHLARDMSDAPMARPTSCGGNHPLWVVGHIALIEGALPQIAFGEPNPVEHWQTMFGQGTTPTDEATDYPPYEEVLGTYIDLRKKNLERLESLGEAGLDAPSKSIPPGFEAEMKTVGQAYLAIAMHHMMHYGQLADARRASGRKPFV